MSLSTTSPDTISTELFKINNNNLNINNNLNYLLDNKYVIAVLYIILFLYASTFAPKIPNWITIYLENITVKIIIVFIIGFLTTKDITVAIIVTICLNIIYLLISENKISNSINKFFIETNSCSNNKEGNVKEDNKEKEDKEDNKEGKEDKEDNKEGKEGKEKEDKEDNKEGKEKENFLQYLQSYQEYNPTINIENFNSKNELINHTTNNI